MEFALVTMALPGRAEEPAGVLLFDADAGRLGVKLRRDWHLIAGEEEAEVLSGMESHLKELSRDMGARQALEWLEGTLSNTLRVSEREQVSSAAFDFTLHQLYRELVPAQIEPYVTHLPRYSLRSAAGNFGEQQGEQNEIAEWVEAPNGIRLTRDMFVAEVYGRSMEPVIPNGSLCIFRHFANSGAGSRNNKRVLVEDRGLSHAGNERYTVKIYRSQKMPTTAGWAHYAIQLEPLNPEFPVIHLENDEDRYAVVAEFMRVLDSSDA
jgi:phage repressor protein C with HTH and peptisase S24 domain